MTDLAALNAQNLCLNYSSLKALDQLSLAIPPGGVTALLGRNGAGKTSFINCALGLLKPDSGALSILNLKAGSRQLKQQIGVMMQDADLPDLLTAREHLTLVCSYYPHALSVEQLIEQCDLNQFADTVYKKLSGGQKRRVQFAVAIAGQPKLVFLDEPTTGLDTQARRTLWQTIRSLSENGTTVLLTTHYLEEADALADHTIVIDQGKAIASGSAQDIRNLAQGSLIRCQTSTSPENLLALDGVLSVKRTGRLLDIRSDQPTSTVRQLLETDQELSDLSVTASSLEDAFEQLVNNSPTIKKGAA